MTLWPILAGWLALIAAGFGLVWLLDTLGVLGR
jgi:hypothetical protein